MPAWIFVGGDKKTGAIAPVLQFPLVLVLEVRVDFAPL